jgi:hypothetical protein
MVSGKMVCAAAAVVMLLLVAGPVLAEESKYEPAAGAAVKDVLKDQVGKRVTLRLDAGEEMEGTVTKVGDQLVHIAKLSRRDFYDAFVRLDRISAVVIKMRGN